MQQHEAKRIGVSLSEEEGRLCVFIRFEGDAGTEGDAVLAGVTDSTKFEFRGARKLADLFPGKRLKSRSPTTENQARLAVLIAALALRHASGKKLPASDVMGIREWESVGGKGGDVDDAVDTMVAKICGPLSAQSLLQRLRPARGAAPEYSFRPGIDIDPPSADLRWNHLLWPQRTSTPSESPPVDTPPGPASTESPEGATTNSPRSVASTESAEGATPPAETPLSGVSPQLAQYTILPVDNLPSKASTESASKSGPQSLSTKHPRRARLWILAAFGGAIALASLGWRGIDALKEYWSRREAFRAVGVLQGVLGPKFTLYIQRGHPLEPWQVRAATGVYRSEGPTPIPRGDYIYVERRHLGWTAREVPVVAPASVDREAGLGDEQLRIHVGDSILAEGRAPLSVVGRGVRRLADPVAPTCNVFAVQELPGGSMIGVRSRCDPSGSYASGGIWIGSTAEFDVERRKYWSLDTTARNGTVPLTEGVSRMTRSYGGLSISLADLDASHEGEPAWPDSGLISKEVCIAEECATETLFVLRGHTRTSAQTFAVELPLPPTLRFLGLKPRAERFVDTALVDTSRGDVPETRAAATQLVVEVNEGLFVVGLGNNHLNPLTEVWLFSIESSQYMRPVGRLIPFDVSTKSSLAGYECMGQRSAHDVVAFPLVAIAVPEDLGDPRSPKRAEAMRQCISRIRIENPWISKKYEEAVSYLGGLRGPPALTIEKFLSAPE